MGTWFNDLPTWTQTAARMTFPALICTNLINSKMNLVKNPEFGALLHHAHNGYYLLYQLALLGDHPLLVDFPRTPTEPRQREQESVVEYVATWQQHLHIRILGGVHLSDRYFLLQFAAGLRTDFCFLRDYLERLLAPYNGPHTIHEPAPLNLNPERILLTIQQHAHVNGVGTLCTTSARTLRAGSTRPGSSLGGNPSSLHLRSLRDADVATTELTDAEYGAFQLFAVTQRPKGSFFCQADDHMLGDCSKFKTLKADPFACKIVRRFLDPPPSRSTAPGPKAQPTPFSPSRRLRQLGFDDPALVTSSEEGNSSSGDDSDHEVPDFRDGRR